MAKKEEAPNMVERFAEFKELKNIDKTTMISVLEESFRNVLAKMFGTDENLDVIMNPDKGDVQIFQNPEYSDKSLRRSRRPGSRRRDRRGTHKRDILCRLRTPRHPQPAPDTPV